MRSGPPARARLEPATLRGGAHHAVTLLPGELTSRADGTLTPMAFWQRRPRNSPDEKLEEAPTPRDLFRAEVETTLAGDPRVRSVQRRPDQFALNVFIGEGDPAIVHLENMFVETREMSPEQRRERIRVLLSGLHEDEDEPDWEEVTGSLVPLVRPATFFAGVVTDPALMPVRRPFLPLLIEAVVIDQGQTMKYVTPRHTAAWSVDDDDVFGAARKNAETCFNDEHIAPYDPEAPYPLWHVAYDDSYQSSRLLLPGWLASFDGKVSGRPVAIIPERSTLVVGGDGDERCLERLIDMAGREFSSSRRRISPALYTVDDSGAVVPLVLPPDRSLANAVALGHTQLAVAEYDIQQEVLQKQLGEDVFVATYTAHQFDDGRIWTYCVWARDAGAILPETEDVFFYEPDEESLQVSWSDVHEIVGNCLERMPGANPPRWRCTGWPDDKQMAQLRQRAIRKPDK